ncbi:MAG: zf-HC2 domain-containing protein [Terriglobales bacterium]
MTEVPKIVYDRLRAALPNQALTGEPHPDADLLTAFVEQALPATERDAVLEHLARCGDCRELIALALPAMDTVKAPAIAEPEANRATASRAGAPTPRKLSFAWPSLRWAALAAGVVVAGAVLLMRPGKLNQATPPPVNSQVATNAQPIPSPQLTSPPPASPGMDQSAISAKTEPAPPRSELRLSKKLKAGQVVTPSLQTGSGMLPAESKIANNKQDLKEADKLSANSSAGAAALNYNVPAIPSSSEAVEVTAESPTLQAEVSSEVKQNGARAVEKAKPASQAQTSQSQRAFAATAGAVPLQGRSMVSMAKLAAPPSPTRAGNVAWMITTGVLQRSLDRGQSWQTSLHADHPLLCYASHDQDVWAGGQAGTLFHSADSGLTWLPVQPSIKSQPLASDLIHIDVRAPAEVVISTSDHELWSSVDNGKTWEKK